MMPLSNALLVEHIGTSIVIKFNRPEIRSPLSLPVLDEIEDIVDGLRGGTNVSGVVFTGVGSVFASGADLRDIAQLNCEESRAFAQRGQNLMNGIATLKQKTLAAINGFCFGGALDVALACDRRIAAPDAVLAHPGADLGIMTGWGGTQRLPRLIGQARAFEMFFLAKRVGAGEALSWGLIDEITEDPLSAALSEA